MWKNWKKHAMKNSSYNKGQSREDMYFHNWHHVDVHCFLIFLCLWLYKTKQIFFQSWLSFNFWFMFYIFICIHNIKNRLLGDKCIKRAFCWHFRGKYRWLSVCKLNNMYHLHVRGLIKKFSAQYTSGTQRTQLMVLLFNIIALYINALCSSVLQFV
jgi:hypothetical protein